MRITQVAYGRTFNTGNYTSERIDLTAEVEAGEDWRAVRLALAVEVYRAGGDMAGMSAARTALARLEAEKA